MNARRAETDLATTDVEEEYAEMELRWLLADEVARLPGCEAAIVIGLYYQQQALAEVASVLGYDKSWACRLHQRALLRLSKRMRNLVFYTLNGRSPDGAPRARPNRPR